jgi:hypothetical protein
MNGVANDYSFLEHCVHVCLTMNLKENSDFLKMARKFPFWLALFDASRFKSPKHSRESFSITGNEKLMNSGFPSREFTSSLFKIFSSKFSNRKYLY